MPLVTARYNDDDGQDRRTYILPQTQIVGIVMIGHCQEYNSLHSIPELITSDDIEILFKHAVLYSQSLTFSQKMVSFSYDRNSLYAFQIQKMWFDQPSKLQIYL